MSTQARASRPVVANGTTGSICKRTGPYVYDNGHIRIVVFVKRGDPFPPAPTQPAASGAKIPSQPADATWAMVSAGK